MLWICNGIFIFARVQGSALLCYGCEINMQSTHYIMHNIKQRLGCFCKFFFYYLKTLHESIY